MSVEAVLAKIAGTYEFPEPPDVDQRVAAYWGGKADEDVAWWMGLAHMVASDPVAQALYLAHVAEDCTRFRAIKEWAYRVAVEFVGQKGSGQRKRSLVESYRVEWGHQAARDGVAIAVWGPDGVPGIVSRAEQFKCGKQAYQRVRDEVQRQAIDLMTEYRGWLGECMSGRHSGEFKGRWETATGRLWRDA
jgi:hypothetical protein